jgi:hypothetical protein
MGKMEMKREGCEKDGNQKSITQAEKSIADGLIDLFIQNLFTDELAR